MKYMSLDQRNRAMAEYVWIDSVGGIRSKTKVCLRFFFFLNLMWPREGRKEREDRLTFLLRKGGVAMVMLSSIFASLIKSVSIAKARDSLDPSASRGREWCLFLK
jgi:hypothetical protein